MSNATCVSQSTLAILNRADRNVTLKIVVARKSGELDHKLRILTYLNRQGDSRHPGYKHVTHLLDFFYHDGTNGRHPCLVLDVLGPTVSLWRNAALITG